MITRVDTAGNVLTLDNTKLSIQLVGESKPRYIGKFIEKVYYKKEREADVFRKLDAWSINAYVFERADKVVIVTEDYRYTLEDTKKPEITLHFKNSGVEPKVYIPRDKFIKTKL